MKKYNSEQLIGFCLQEVTIECAKCKKVDGEYQSSLDYAMPEFFSRGWRATEKHCYCPKCAKKYLK